MNIRVGPQGKADRQVVAAVIAARGFHVQHLVDANDLSLERLRHTAFHDRRGSTWIVRRNLYLWRNDVRELLHRHAQHRDGTRHHDHNRDDDRSPGRSTNTAEIIV
jgi:hypothetical protein